MDDETGIPSEIDRLPFSGRRATYAQIQQYLIDPTGRRPMLIMAWHNMGKTALLRHFNHVFDEDIIGVYFPLADCLDDWPTVLVDYTNATLEAANFNVARLPAIPTPEPDDEEYDFRAWLTDIYFPEMFKLLRPHRRIAWLMDDAQHLISAVDIKRIAADEIDYLAQLAANYPQLGIILTLDTLYEDKLDRLQPLIEPASVYRLSNLNAQDSTDLIHQFAPDISDQAMQTVYQMTAGHPLLLWRFGEAINAAKAPIDSAALQDITLTVYKASQDDFRAIWLDLNRNERMVLTAISSLIYTDPLRQLDTTRIQSWLVETDDPMDLITINATIRSLEYRDIISGDTNDLRLTIPLMQKWLLENARLESTSPIQPGESIGVSTRDRWLVVILAIILMIVLLLALGILAPGPSEVDLVPTVTLSN